MNLRVHVKGIMRLSGDGSLYAHRVLSGNPHDGVIGENKSPLMLVGLDQFIRMSIQILLRGNSSMIVGLMGGDLLDAMSAANNV